MPKLIVFKGNVTYLLKSKPRGSPPPPLPPVQHGVEGKPLVLDLSISEGLGAVALSPS